MERVRYIIFFGVIGFCTIHVINCFSQNINELRNKKSEIEKSIIELNSILKATEKQKKNSLENLELVKKKIELQSELIRQLDSEEVQLQNQILKRQQNVDSLAYKVSILKEEYNKIIQVSYKNRDKRYLIMLILSSDDFNRAYKRIRFFKQVIDYRKNQISILRNAILHFQNEKEMLAEDITKLNLKQKEKQVELQKLNEEKNNYNQKLIELNKRKKELIADLEKKKIIAKRLNEEITRLVEEEAKRLREEQNKSKISELGTLSSIFKENIGKFKKPIDNGILTGYYGESNHPILKGVKVKNNGVDFSIEGKTNVYSIFEGEVRKIITIPGSGIAVIIRHGNYLTVYSNLTRINIKVNQKVNTNQKIGEIDAYTNSEKNYLHFEIWNENKTENPEKWLNFKTK